MRYADWLRRQFQSLPLRGKITVTLLALSAMLGGIMAGASFLYSRHLILSNAEDLLAARSQQKARSLEIKLKTALSLVESLAGNSITANSLADSEGRNLYMVPTLRAQKLPFQQATLVLTDYRGRILASSSGAEVRPGVHCMEHPAFLEMMRSGKPAALIHAAQANAEPGLFISYPVVYQLTGNIEGALILTIPVGELLDPGERGESIWLTYRNGHIGRPVDTLERVEATQALSLPGPLDTLGLAQSVGEERKRILNKLNTLLWIYASFALGLFILILLLARISANHLATPLQALASVAEKMARSGRPSTYIEHAGNDEFGRLAGAFNTMIEKLRASYADLEDQVEQRTRELSESASRLRYVMEVTGEGIWDWDIPGGRVTHNLVWCDMLDLESKFIEHDIDIYPRLIHPEDLGRVQEAIRVCLEDGIPFRIEYRIQAPTGRALWVLDRGNVVEWDARGKAKRMVGSISDITERIVATQALRERELYLRATLDNLPFLFWLKDADSRFLIVNKAFSDACGQASPEAVAGLTDDDVWPSDLAAMYRADDREVIGGMREKAVEEPVEENGVRGWIETFKKPVIAENGDVLGTVGFARNITDRKLIEEALRESEQRWGLAIAGANDGIWDWRLNSHEVFFSDRWKTMLGYAPAEIEDRFEVWREHVHPEDLRRVMTAIDRHLHGETEFFEAEFRMLCKDGSYNWILSKGKALFDADRRPIRMCGSHSDISARRTAQEQARDRSDLLNAIFTLSPDGFVSFDQQRRVNYVSPAFMQLTTLSPGEVLGLDEQAFARVMAGICVTDGFPGIDRLRAAQVSGEVQRQTCELRQPLARILEVGLRLGSTPAVTQIMYFRDITHEAEVDRMKSEFLSTAAHELRTPMSSIYGFSQLLLTENFGAEMQKELFGIIFSQSELMVSIINELLDLARIEARQGKDFNIEQLDIGCFIESVLQGFKTPDGRAKPILSLLPGSYHVRGDRKKLTQAINNMLSNAYKYSPGGGAVDVEVLSRAGDSQAPQVGIRIVDAGIGMTQAQLARVFERFFRADTSGKIPGTGLGMSIVKEIIELHRGQIDLASEPGAGTRITIWLPMQESIPVAIAA